MFNSYYDAYLALMRVAETADYNARQAESNFAKTSQKIEDLKTQLHTYSPLNIYIWV